MTDDRWVVLGLAHPRANWFSELARWSTAAAVPVDFVKCVSVDEVRARLSTGRPYSALLIGGDVAGLGPDLVEAASTTGAAVIVVGSMTGRDWTAIGADALLPGPFERADLMATLAEHAPPISPVTPTIPDIDPTSPLPNERGRLIAVTGAGGSGTSTVAMALAQTLGSDFEQRSAVLLADLALDADLAMLHDAREVVPGLQELVEAHRMGRLDRDEVRALTFDAVGRGYQLLLGLRRHRDWTAIRPRAFTATLDGLSTGWRWVVADVDPDIEGEAETGSADIEDRNMIARTVQQRADCTLVTGTPGVKGLQSLTRTIRDLLTFGVSGDRLIPVVTRAPRSPRRRADITATVHALIEDATDLRDLPRPIFSPERTDLDAALHDGSRLPQALGAGAAARVRALTAELDERSIDKLAPVPVIPGRLGTWTDEEDR